MFRHYLSAAIGNLSRNRLYAAVTIGGLSVAFAAALLVALFVRHELSYDRWISGHERTYLVSQVLTPPANGASQAADPTRSDIAELLRLNLPQVEASARMARGEPLIKRGEIEANEPNFFWADPNLFSILPLKAIAGDLSAALQQPDGLVLTRALARKYFGRDTPIGETLQVNPAVGSASPSGVDASDTFNTAHSMRVTAVIEDLPSNTHLKAEAFGSGLASFSGLARLDAHPAWPFGQTAYTYVRLKPGVRAEDVRDALPALVGRHIPAAPLLGGRFALEMRPIAELHFAPAANLPMKPRGDRVALNAAAGVAALIVLMASINFIMLMTARAARRAVEVRVRKAAGARRRDLTVQFIGEVLVYVAVAMLVSLAMAELLLPAANAFLQRSMRFDLVREPIGVAAIVAAAVAIALLAGLYPALVLSSFRPAAVLKGGVSPSGSGGLRKTLVVIQFAVLTGLVLATATLYRQTDFALNRALQFQRDQVVWIDDRCTGPFRESLLSTPGVRAVSCAGGVALTASHGAPTTALSTDGRTTPVEMAAVDFNFFDFYGVSPVAGRLFAHARGTDALLSLGATSANPAIILNETAARRLGFGSAEAAIGKVISWRRLVMPNDAPPHLQENAPSEIVGVVPDFSMGSVREPIEPTLYFVDPGLYGAISVRIDAGAAPATLRRLDSLWKAAGHARPMKRQFMAQANRDLYTDVVTQAAVVSICAGVAVVIAALGLFALTAFTTEQRTKEIGIRKAMGASKRDVVRLLLWQFTKPVLLANLIALPVAWWAMDRWLRGFTYRIDLSPWLFLAASAAALAIALATVATHAVLVARAKPVGALRYE